MRISRDAERWVAESTYEERAIPKRAGWRWDPKDKCWWTDDIEKAARLAEYADEGCADELRPILDEQQAALAASRAVDSDIDVPAPDGLAYLPYQRGGIAFAAAREACLIGDEMGLGKTIQALGVINLDESIRRVLVVCPASLKANWAIEARKWLVRDMSVGIAAGRRLPDADVVIVNYAILTKLPLDSVEWDLLIADECHYAKNPKAKRTKALFAVKAARRILLTGTPIVNRPVELWPLIKYLDPKRWKNKMRFGWRYCGAHQNAYGYWDFSGATNLDELQEILRSTIMVRRLKVDVLTDLPPKVRQVVELPSDGMDWAHESDASDAYDDLQAAEEEVDALDESAPGYEAAVGRLKQARRFFFDEISRVRHETALAKVPHAIEHLHNALEDGRKIVCFAHHHDVIEALASEFGDSAVVIYGETNVDDRQGAVDRFQSDPDCRLFVGSIGAAGVGLTLTAAAHVVFVELDWVPGNVSQAEDRCHRIGQRDSVLVQHLVFNGSIDARIARTIIAKQRVIDDALDTQHLPAEPAQPKPVAHDPELPAAQVEAIHNGLRMLAAFCDGAREVDGAGFNKLDTDFGKSLAGAQSLSPKQARAGRKLVRKYRRQLPDDLVAVAVDGPQAEVTA